jgi:gamma-glutamyltranspeptidase / glutathione hydrolase
MAVLERGGNAFDAAVAAGLVLQVTEPHLATGAVQVRSQRPSPEGDGMDLYSVGDPPRLSDP